MEEVHDAEEAAAAHAKENGVSGSSEKGKDSEGRDSDDSGPFPLSARSAGPGGAGEGLESEAATLRPSQLRAKHRSALLHEVLALSEAPAPGLGGDSSDWSGRGDSDGGGGEGEGGAAGRAGGAGSGAFTSFRTAAQAQRARRRFSALLHGDTIQMTNLLLTEEESLPTETTDSGSTLAKARSMEAVVTAEKYLATGKLELGIATYDRMLSSAAVEGNPELRVMVLFRMASVRRKQQAAADCASLLDAAEATITETAFAAWYPSARLALALHRVACMDTTDVGPALKLLYVAQREVMLDIHYTRGPQGLKGVKPAPLDGGLPSFADVRAWRVSVNRLLDRLAPVAGKKAMALEDVRSDHLRKKTDPIQAALEGTGTGTGARGGAGAAPPLSPTETAHILHRPPSGRFQRPPSALARLKMDAEYLKQRRAATQIQRSMRGYLARKRVTQAQDHRWLPCYDASSGAYYYMDTYTGASRWTLPQCVSPKWVSIKVVCEYCSGAPAVGYCLQCNVSICGSCVTQYHPDDEAHAGCYFMPVYTGDPICPECELKLSISTCAECEQGYCMGCLQATHSKGSRQKHTIAYTQRYMDAWNGAADGSLLPGVAGLQAAWAAAAVAAPVAAPTPDTSAVDTRGGATATASGHTRAGTHHAHSSASHAHGHADTTGTDTAGPSASSATADIWYDTGTGTGSGSGSNSASGSLLLDNTLGTHTRDDVLSNLPTDAVLTSALITSTSATSDDGDGEEDGDEDRTLEYDQ